MHHIRFVVATRETESDFYTKTATGRSLLFYKSDYFDVRLFAANTRGLSEVYNIALDECRNTPCTLVFIHDDVHILEYFWAEKIEEAAERFDIAGVAGNVRRVAGQPAWAFVNDAFTWDARENLSGVVGHGKGFPPANLSVFGPAGREVKLMDGLILVAKSQTLLRSDVRFDPRFQFHFYDMDLCRQAEAKGLKMGTMVLSLIHESPGSFGGESWRRAYSDYLAKWKE